MNCLELQIKKAQQKKEKLFCAYVTLGYPNVPFTEKLILALEGVGVDIIELGIPFSDPLADGPTIQESSYHALTNNTKVYDAFNLVSRLRKRGVSVPVVFFSYYNIIFHYGIKPFIKKLKQSGFDGVLCPDLPPEEDECIEKELRENNISLIYLIAPTSSSVRIKMLARKSKGFIYYVSRRGVTGARHDIAKDLSLKVKQIKKNTAKSVLVGFGISDKKQIRTICSLSDGVIVGSAIIDQIKRTKSVAKTAQFVQKLVKEVKSI